jgi:hypothetical protein
VNVPNPRRVIVEAVLVAAIGVAVLTWAGFTADPAVQYTALAAIFAFVALLAAFVAVRTTWPQYEAWRRAQLATPILRVSLAVAPNDSSVPQPIGKTFKFETGFILVVQITNKGKAPLREAMLNIVVPTTCDIQPLDPAKVHYLSPLPEMSQELVPGQNHQVRWTVVRDTITPGDHVFHARIQALTGQGPYPLMVELSGDPSPDEAQRFTRVTAHL